MDWQCCVFPECFLQGHFLSPLISSCAVVSKWKLVAQHLHPSLLILAMAQMKASLTMTVCFKGLCISQTAISICNFFFLLHHSSSSIALSLRCLCKMLFFKWAFDVNRQGRLCNDRVVWVYVFVSCLHLSGCYWRGCWPASPCSHQRCSGCRCLHFLL